MSSFPVWGYVKSTYTELSITSLPILEKAQKHRNIDTDSESLPKAQWKITTCGIPILTLLNGYSLLEECIVCVIYDMSEVYIFSNENTVWYRPIVGYMDNLSTLYLD